MRFEIRNGKGVLLTQVEQSDGTLVPAEIRLPFRDAHNLGSEMCSKIEAAVESGSAKSVLRGTW